MKKLYISPIAEVMEFETSAVLAVSVSVFETESGEQFAPANREGFWF